MKINILTAFPEFFDAFLQYSLIKKAINNKILKFNIINIRNYGLTNYKKIDDAPYGGGAGMIMRADVIENAINDNFNKEDFIKKYKNKFFITSPRGVKFNQKIAFKIANIDEIIILCNRYEGVDQRAIDYYKMKEISIGNFILMGGEVAAIAILESCIRLIPNVINNYESIRNETFSFGKNKEHNQYTRPKMWNNLDVPEILTSGDHFKINEWKNKD